MTRGLSTRLPCERLACRLARTPPPTQHATCTPPCRCRLEGDGCKRAKVAICLRTAHRPHGHEDHQGCGCNKGGLCFQTPPADGRARYPLDLAVTARQPTEPPLPAILPLVPLHRTMAAAAGKVRTTHGDHPSSHSTHPSAVLGLAAGIVSLVALLLSCSVAMGACFAMLFAVWPPRCNHRGPAEVPPLCRTWMQS